MESVGDLPAPGDILSTNIDIIPLFGIVSEIQEEKEYEIRHKRCVDLVVRR